MQKVRQLIKDLQYFLKSKNTFSDYSLEDLLLIPSSINEPGGSDSHFLDFMIKIKKVTSSEEEILKANQFSDVQKILAQKKSFEKEKLILLFLLSLRHNLISYNYNNRSIVNKRHEFYEELDKTLINVGQYIQENNLFDKKNIDNLFTPPSLQVIKSINQKTDLQIYNNKEKKKNILL